ncbi:hypothetical protein G8S49_07175 [Clostridium botulinum C]|uniref:Uncharacterized protein n=3 Tax=Clostridium botulinum TaxID=1491 RepID=A0A9Q4TG33_CLOBO|nr:MULTISPECIES: hypothetical protein [Clostridium]EGO88361.1 hypothetical protein CBCST_06073 [Clostridium botulinum C str. Stockholm]AYF53802.1 hypothetical protein DFH04_03020 [Clostridium novyi]EES91435.1 conserved hypothetical protein [Clostridium botulinum D str. 1873]MBO3442357.1 hypothetical protein [Clostridium haemolyticum]MCD3195232.1 hypothetical protein [Clostridium botulinum C]
MSKYYLKILNKMNLSDYSKIYDYMGLVNSEDKFIVDLSHSSLENTSIIYHMLKNHNFNICCRGGNDNEGLFITASRNKIN